jgi:hypothetical protein
VEATIRERLSIRYGFDFVGFNGKVTVSDINKVMVGINGLDYVEVTDLSMSNAFPEPTPPDTRTDTIFLNDVGPNVLQHYNPTIEPGKGSLYLTMYGGATS